MSPLQSASTLASGSGRVIWSTSNLNRVHASPCASVNGQVEVPGFGQVEVPTLCGGDQGVGSSPPRR
ncbi:hypothetical protein [Ornithinimicrobium kibberense]|uniref:hypothetical protein n=1 Tax=Ornithinimicrobium kibberense TaxID=282060 RepID=UPI003619D599